MKGARIALAGLLALGAAGLWYDSPSRPPVLVADSATAAQCRSWATRAQAQERHQEGWLAIFEGFSTLQGLCHPQDVARGRALAESALARGLDPQLAIDLALALRKVGDEQGAAEWATLAAYVYFRTATRRGFMPLRDSETARTIEPAYRAFFDNRTWEKDLADLEHLLGRPAKVPAVEPLAIEMLLRRVERGDETLGNWLRYRARVEARVALDGPSRNQTFLANAARCGHTEAIRKLAAMVLSGEAEESRLGLYTDRVAWLHRRRTRDEGDLLVALLTNGGPRSWASMTDHMIALFDQTIVDRCPVRKPLGTPLFPGD
jgi:hypothetical protein